jgi:ArsR family transcriptional regulator, arsenate/arsenite/antimonite-responsive transcriptional repressor / arsenate reductase (thioredoxin)
MVLRVARRAELVPPPFLELAGHPVRWRLLEELVGSDRHVGELTDRVGEPQSLVSYHLARLRRAGLVTTQASAADARRAYYHVDLLRCGELLAAAGGALHPALGPSEAAAAPPAGSRDTRAGRGGPPRRVPRLLFLCTGNSARSQMAEALAVDLSSGRVEARSAGSHPKPLHRNAVAVMARRGIDIAGASTKHLRAFGRMRFDHVVTLCDKVREVCPEFRGHPDRIHWSIPDPARGGGSDTETYPAFERTAQELETRVRFLLSALAVSPVPVGS